MLLSSKIKADETLNYFFFHEIRFCDRKKKLYVFRLVIEQDGCETSILHEINVYFWMPVIWIFSIQEVTVSLNVRSIKFKILILMQVDEMRVCIAYRKTFFPLLSRLRQRPTHLCIPFLMTEIFNCTFPHLPYVLIYNFIIITFYGRWK